MAAQPIAHEHRPVSLDGVITCRSCADLHVTWKPEGGDRLAPPDFGKSGMASWTDTDAPG